MKKIRRSMLFTPANNYKMMTTAHLKGSDCVIFDLEDAITYSEKSNARKILCNTIRNVNYGNVEIFARINPLYTLFGEEDVKELVDAGIKNIRLPMCENKDNIKELDDMLTYYENIYNIKKGTVKIQGSIETPKGVLNALEIATSSERMISISFGAEDFTNSLGTNRLMISNEFLYARSHIILCASSAGLDSIDTVYSDIKNLEGFRAEVIEAKNLGFSGKSCIHPSQIKIVHETYTPTKKEVEEALKIISEVNKVKENGKGVLLVDGKMVDKPVIEKSQRILDLADFSGITK